MSVVKENEIQWFGCTLYGEAQAHEGYANGDDFVADYLYIRGLEAEIKKEYEEIKDSFLQKLCSLERGEQCENPSIHEYTVYGAYKLIEHFRLKRQKEKWMEEAMTEPLPKDFIDLFHSEFEAKQFCVEAKKPLRDKTKVQAIDIVRLFRTYTGYNQPYDGGVSMKWFVNILQEYGITKLSYNAIDKAFNPSHYAPKTKK